MSDAPREKDSERDGFLSYSAEWHAVAHGFYDGMRTIKPVTRKLPDNKDVQREPHYYKGAFVVATFVQLVVVYLLATGVAGGL